jgi:hypothetical protein
MDVAGEGELGRRTRSAGASCSAASVGACSATAGGSALDGPTLTTGIDVSFGSSVATEGSGVVARAAGSGPPVCRGGSPESGREGAGDRVACAAARCDGETAGSVDSGAVEGEGASPSDEAGAAAGREGGAEGSGAAAASAAAASCCVSPLSSSPHSPSISSVSRVGGMLTAGGYESLPGYETVRGRSSAGAAAAVLAGAAAGAETVVSSGASELTCGGGGADASASPEATAPAPWAAGAATAGSSAT